MVFILAVAVSSLYSAQQVSLLKIRKYRLSFLDEKLQETSGLDFFKGKLYTFNDSGNSPEIFEISKSSGKIIRTLQVNAQNKDWEALANDGSHFYIGDFGNNGGTRRDLELYKVPFKDGNIINDSVKKISYYYPDQEEFVPKYYKNDYDAEAMIFLNGKLHVFTKEWASKSTTHYTIDPEVTDKQQAEKAESFKTNYMVTDASYFDKKLYLVGYTKKTEVFLDIFSETEPGIFFKEKPRHYYLGSALSIGQIEGIAVDESGIYISGEKFRSPLGSSKPSLYFIPEEKLNKK